MKIYVTGATGLVGHNLVDALSSSGHEVITSRHADVDLTDYGTTLGFISAARPDMVIHTAGKVGGIKANMEDCYGFMVENMKMGMNVVSASLAAGVKKMINLSTACAYPRDITSTLKEEDVMTGRLEPTNEGYAIAKLSVMRMCAFASRQFGVNYKTVIPGNLFGRYDKFGENAHMLPAAIQKLHIAKERGDSVVTIWGTGKPLREFLFAADFADMLVQCIDKFDDMPELMNLGFGREYTIDEYYRFAADVVGYTGSFEHDTSRPDGMGRKLMDTSKQEALGIMPKHDISYGIAETYRYFLSLEK